MTSTDLSRRTIAFVNFAHALDHFVLLIFPTAVIAVAAEQNVPYAALIALSTGGFVAFGLFSLPAGWLADKVGRRNLLALFFFGCGFSCLALGLAAAHWHFALGLSVLGMFAAIYHPVGLAMLVSHTRRLGRDLGKNGVWGNMGAAFASIVSAALAAFVRWRFAFLVPGLVCLVAGTLFVLRVPGDGDTVASARKASSPALAVNRAWAVLAVFAVALIAGGVTFNIITIALPKLIDERLGFSLPLSTVGSLATAVFVIGALTQLTVGWLMERTSLPSLFVGLSILQPLGLALAAISTGWAMLAGLTLAMAALYGEVVVNDAMVARYVPGRYQARAFGLRYFIGFTTAGAAVPLLSLLHGLGGFPYVLAGATAFGALILATSVAFFVLMRPNSARACAPSPLST